MNLLTYIVVSPMKNEERYVLKTLESMAAQAVVPTQWVIVNDGSTDRSVEIVQQFADQYPWIKLVNTAGLGNRLPEHYGGHVVDLVFEGLRNITVKDYDCIVKLDCDISFESDFFQRILNAFATHPKLGITSGISFLVQPWGVEEEKTAESHTLGATKTYRRECFEEIGGLVSSMGWDGIDEIKARMKGWEARPLRDLRFLHHRPEGTASGLLASGIERGKGSYFMGYHPLFMVFRAIYRMLRKPSLLADGVGMLSGYFASLFQGAERIPDIEFIRFLRRQQIRKLFLLRSEI
jgi:glycosyltransferase involved in cell wall biosynthesis